MDESTKDQDIEILQTWLRDRDVACPACGYNLRDQVREVCPECGKKFKLQLGLEDLHVISFVVFLAPILGWISIALLIGIGWVVSGGRLPEELIVTWALGLIDLSIASYCVKKWKWFVAGGDGTLKRLIVISWIVHSIASVFFVLTAW